MNHLIRLLASQASFPRVRVATAALLSGLNGTLVLAIVNLAAREIADSGRAQVDWRLAALFAAGTAIYALAEVFVVARICAALESAVHDLRGRLLDRLAHADFEKVESIGRSDLYEGITQASQTISQNSQFLALGLRSLVMILAILAYIAWVSITAFVLVLSATAVGGLFYHRAGQRLAKGFARMMDADKRMFESLGDLLDGFQEVRLSSARRRDLSSAFAEVSDAATGVRAEVQVSAMQQFVLGQVAVFFLLAVVVFVVPLYSPSFRGEVVQVATSVLFMAAAIGAVIQTIPLLGASEQAAIRMLLLDRRLAEAREEADAADAADAAAPPAAFREIALRAVTYAYPAPEGETGFTLGPIDLTLRAGEVIFVTGGNGSGKSTLIKLLTGLTQPHSGAMKIDGETVGPRNRRAFRALVSPVFSDCHLFPRLYGAEAFSPDEAQELFAWMELGEAARLSGDRVEHVALSAGQKKRLALIAALLEHRPLLVLDEWAADQDPHFRRKFYREVLPALKARGKTIVAVTHDDAYFDAADRRLHLEEGRLTEIAAKGGA